MQWTATDRFEDANHHPKAVVNGDQSIQCIYMDVKAGDTLRFDASASSDVDGDSLTYGWSVYAEPSTYKGNVTVEKASESICRLTVPQDASGKTIHLILEVTDTGIPQLTVYRRIVLSVE